MFQRNRARKPIPRLRHEQVVELFVDYHFGRLSPELNTAVERHVRSCARCKREGMSNVANERRGAVRKLRGVRGGKPLLSRRTRTILLALTLILVAQVLVYQVINGRATALLALLSNGHASGVTIGGSDTPAVRLHPANALPLITSGATAIALSADDGRLAVAGGDGHRNVVVWDLASQKSVLTLPWSDTHLPNSIAWSQDGSRLAAASGAQIVIWDTSTGATLWQLGVPQAPAMRVYDVSQQVVVGRPDPASAFNQGALAWGADGSLTPAPTGALGPVGISTPQAPVIGMWSSAGSHLFAGSGGAALVGASSDDAQRGMALLDWSPGGQYLLWGALSQPVAIGAASPAGSSHAPDSVVGQLASHIAQTGANASAIVWFAPVGKLVAVCDQTTPGAVVTMIDIASGHAIYQLDDPCDALTAHSALWSSSGKSFTIVPSKGPVETYTIPS